MNDERKTIIKMKNWLYQRQRRSGSLDYNILNAITKNISSVVNSSEYEYHDRHPPPHYHHPTKKKLNNPKTAKTYWLILEIFLNGSKIPVIPPLLVGNRLIFDVLAKADLLNDFFSKQCSAIVNNSSLSTNVTFENENRLSSFDFYKTY